MQRSIATRTGDDGTTSLLYGRRIAKDHPRIETVGALDELNVALGAAKLMILTDVPGLYRTWPPDGDVLSAVGAGELEKMLPGLSTGMIPKMEACLTAVRGGVPQAHVLDGRQPHAVLLENFTDSGAGTMVVPDAPANAAKDGEAGPR